MGKIIVQFNRKVGQSVLGKYIGEETSSSLNLDDWELSEVKQIIEEACDEKIILILHDKEFGSAAIFVNDMKDKIKLRKVAKLKLDDCNNFLKRANVLKLEGEYGYVRVHTSNLYDYYYDLFTLNESYGIPSMRLEGDTRNVYLRQKDRVIYSDLYKRMVDKAQIYSARKSIYVRNRLSHTAEVVSISEAIVNAMNRKVESQKINMDLTRTIAYAHDLGHTPFGHSGERAIEEFLKDQDTEFRYFKHNYNGVRVLTYVEESYKDYCGINVFPEVCAGVLGHTSLSNKHAKDEPTEDEVKGYIQKYYNYYGDELLNYGEDIFKLIRLEGKRFVCKFIEGQIVSAADEIAQKGHDIEDSILTGIVTVDEILSYLQPYIDNNRVNYKNKVIEKIYGEVAEIKEYSNIKIAAKKITSIIIHYLTEDLIDNFDGSEMENSLNEKYMFSYKEKVKFSEMAEDFIKLFRSFTYDRIICSREVIGYDQHGDRILKALLKAYVEDIRLLPDSVLKRLNLQLYKQNKSCEIDFKSLDDRSMREISVAFGKGNRENSKLYKEIILREIVDFVSSLTDSYAERLYEEIFKVKLSVY